MNIEYGTFCKTQSTDIVANTLLLVNNMNIIRIMLIFICVGLSACGGSSESPPANNPAESNIWGEKEWGKGTWGE